MICENIVCGIEKLCESIGTQSQNSVEANFINCVKRWERM